MSLPSRRMQPGVFLLFRRLRAPLIALIVVYAVAVLGFTLIPGVDAEGRAWRMSFFHAFYFVSFLGTTIGLGEIPYSFTDAQRMWAVVSIYSTVVTWLYGIGELLATLQDPLFRRIVHEGRVGNAVARIGEPFVLLCGYDDAGTLVTREITESNIGAVVVDRNPARIEALEIDELPVAVPGLKADAVEPAALLRAGITHPNCIATLALTGDDAVNLTVSLTAKLLAPEREVICVAHHHAHHAAMARVGVEHIINPFDTFAERLAFTVEKPSLHVIYEALTTQTATVMAEPMRIPRGRWLVCGYGRFGRIVARHLRRIGIEVSVVNDRPIGDGGAEAVIGDALDIRVMREAGIESADAVVAATSSDTLNLAIAMMARELRHDVFLVLRQNERRNTPMFRAINAEISTLSGYIVAAEVLRIIRAPQLSYFLRLARQQHEDWAGALLERMRERIGEHSAESWSLAVDEPDARGLKERIARGLPVRLGDLMRAPDNRELRLHAVPLLLQHPGGKELLPDDDALIAEGDRILFCGRDIARLRLRRSVGDLQLLDYVLDGKGQPYV